MRFLNLAEKRSGLLPGWWSRECERAAAEAAEMGVDARKVNRHWVNEEVSGFFDADEV